MSKSVPLDAFMRRLSRQAEETFAEAGEISPFWVFYARDGEEGYVGTPFRNQAEKHAIREGLRKFFKERDVVRYGFVMETWMGPANSTDIRPSEHPDRVECIIIGIQDERAGRLCGSRDIIRPSAGKPHLGPLTLMSLRQTAAE